MIIYLTGIDGSGKSSIMQLLETEVFAGNEVRTIWARYQPKFVKFLIFPFKRKFISDNTNGHPINTKEYSEWFIFKEKITSWKIVSKMLFLIQALDYLSQLIRVRRIIRKNKEKIIIIDRFTLDFIVDQSINYGDIENHFITKHFLKILNGLDYIFLIDTNEEVAFNRKDDIPSIEYLTKRRKQYKFYLGKLPNGIIIDNNNNITEALNKIKSYCVL
jgi:thymidylate kinase